MSVYNVGKISRISDSEYVWLLKNFGSYHDVHQTNSHLHLHSNPVLIPSLECTCVFKLSNQSPQPYVDFWLERMSTSSHLTNIEVCILSDTNEKLYTAFIQKYPQITSVSFIKTDILLNSKGLLTADGDLRMRVRIEKVTSQLNIEKDTSIKLQALDQFEVLLDNQELADVRFVVEGKTIYANKAMLISRSSVFLAMFKHQMREAREDAVEITDIKYDVLLETLRFIYAGKVNGIEKFSKDLLATADKYELDGLKEMCTAQLCGNMSVENVVEYLNLADLHSVQQLRDKAIRFIVDNGKTMVNRPEFDSIVHLHKGVFLEVVRTVLSQEKIKTYQPVKRPTFDDLRML